MTTNTNAAPITEQPEALRLAAQPSRRENEMAVLIRRIVSSARRNCEDDSNVLKLANEAWSYLCRAGLAAPWWRKRADEIEVEVARSGSPEAMRCYTKMRQLLDATQSQEPPAFQGEVARHSDQSVLVTFPSSRLASEFERSLGAERESATQPIGKVESASFGAGGFHVRLAEGADMPGVGAPLYTAAPSQDAEDAARLKVVIDLLRDTLGPLEVSAAVIESDDLGQMRGLIDRIKQVLDQHDAARAKQINASLGQEAFQDAEGTKPVTDAGEAML